MAAIPENVRRTVEEITAKYANDLPKAIEESVAAVRGLPDYKKLVDTLVRDSVQDLVYACRHSSNTNMKRQSGSYGGQSKVLANSPTVNRVHESYYTYCIAGKTLGEVVGSEIDSLVKSEEMIASGHVFNARLLLWLKGQGVTGEKRVKDVVSEKKLQVHFKRLQKEVQRPEPAMAGN